MNYDPNTQRYDANSAANRAPRGSVVAIYATGLGDTDRACAEGGVNPKNPPFAKPVLPVRVLIGDREAKLEFVGLAPGFVRGVFQINVTVPGFNAVGLSARRFTVGGVVSASSLILTLMVTLLLRVLLPESSKATAVYVCGPLSAAVNSRKNS